MPPLRISLVQMSCATDEDENLRKAIGFLHQSAKQGANLACLPELFRSQYFCQKEDIALFDLAEPIPGPTSEALGQVAKDTGMIIIGSIFEKRAAGIFHNTAVLIQADGSIGGLYRKMHIPHDPLYFEKYYFTPGDLGFRTFATDVGKIGALVCWDQWFPEAARLTALQGAQILFYPTAIGWHPKEKAEHGQAQREAWETIQRSHAIANGVFVAAVNRIGHEGPSDAGLEFWGNSFVCDPFGRVLQRAASDKEEIVIVDCDLQLVEETRRNWPFFRDRRIDAYHSLSQRFLDQTKP